MENTLKKEFIDYYKNRNDKNNLFLVGQLEYDTKYCPSDERKNGIRVYKNVLGLTRFSGVVDHIPVKLPIYEDVDLNELTEGTLISIEGNLCAISRKVLDENDNLKNKMEIFALAKRLYINENMSYELFGDHVDNRVIVEGDICSDVVKRKTPSGIFLADYQFRNVSRNANGVLFRNYIPCVSWGKEAWALPTERHSFGTVEGRIQSRDYVNSKGEQHTALELSASHFKSAPNPYTLSLKRK